MVTKNFIAICEKTHETLQEQFPGETSQSSFNDVDGVLNRDRDEMAYMEEKPNQMLVEEDSDFDDEIEEPELIEIKESYLEHYLDLSDESECPGEEDNITTFPIPTTSKNTNQNKTFSCESCGKSYKSETSLKIHNLSESHAEIKAKNGLECPICKKILKSRKTLRGHQLTHSNLRPFQCELCEKSYKKNYSLIKHRKLHYIPGPYPYRCEVCKCYFKKIQQKHLHKKEKHPKKKIMNKTAISIMPAGIAI